MKISASLQFLITFVFSLIILAFVAILCKGSQFTIPALTRDITTTAGVHPLTGFLSNSGILLWCATGSVCAFSTFILYKRKPGRIFWFLLSSALLSLYLLFDDLFLFHDYLSEYYLHFSEEKVYFVLILSLAIYLFAFRQIILHTRYIFLLLSLGFFAGSLVVDVILQPYIESSLGPSWRIFMEDGSKWIAIVFWFSYFLHTSINFVRGSLSKADLKNQA